MLADRDTAPDLAGDVSIVEVEEFPLSSLPGTLVSWIEVVGDEAVEHPFVGGLWDLLPEERDLPGGFRLYQINEQGTVYTPEGAPIPAYEATR